MPSHYQYNAATDEFTVFCRTYNEEPLAVVKVSMADSHKLMRAIDRLVDSAHEAGVSQTCAAIEQTIENLSI